MNMKEHILAGLHKQLERWEQLLAGVTEAQIVAPRASSAWSVKDEIAHLWAWQQRSVARVQAAREDREPRFPEWAVQPGEGGEGETERINAWLHESNRDRAWSDVHSAWREGYRRMIEAAEPIGELELLDSSRYPWMNGYSLAAVLLASYEHHQEHLDWTLEWLRSAAKAEG